MEICAHMTESLGFNVCIILKGVLSKNLQKPYICDQGGYYSWGDGARAYHVDTLGPTKTQGYRTLTHGAKPLLGATDDRGGYHWSRCHTPLGRILRWFL